MTTKASPVRVTGPLADQAEGFRAELTRRGYTPLSAANLLRVLAHLSRWLDARGMSGGDLTVEQIEAFVATRRAEGRVAWISPRGLTPVLGYLRCEGVIPVPPAVPAPVTPVEVLLDAYRCYLANERGLISSTVKLYAGIARQFLDSRCDTNGGELGLDALDASAVAAFVVAECPKHRVGSAKLIVSGLRSLLGFLYLSGRIASPLAAAVPSVAGWRGGALPRALPPADVARLLSSCDRRRNVGRRDLAILMLLVRLGLRAGEVAALTLDDVDWRAGELVVRGKGRRDERLPLPADVGEALAGYLRRGRPSSADRAVFMTARAPYRAATVHSVTGAVRYAGVRVGMTPMGAHRLRHTAATEMLQGGATLAEIGQVLRHRDLSTTAIYAKVDRDALRTLAMRWPGGEA